MFPSHLDGGSHVVCQDDELRRPAVVMGAEADDVDLCHSGRKIAKKPGESKGGAPYEDCLIPYAGECYLLVFITATVYLGMTMHTFAPRFPFFPALGAYVLDVKMRRLIEIRNMLDARATATGAARTQIVFCFAPNALDRVGVDLFRTVEPHGASVPAGAGHVDPNRGPWVP